MTTEVDRHTDRDRTAEQEARAADELIATCLANGTSFVVAAGAGAGKTSSLVAALRQIRSTSARTSAKRVACITYTNAAKAELNRRIDSDQSFVIATLHEFFWEEIQPYAGSIVKLLDPANWKKAFARAEVDGFSSQRVEYSRGYRRVTPEVVSLHHDDIPLLAARLLENRKFRERLASRYSAILIDEYQDTNALLGTALLTFCVERHSGPMFGLFGDGWQQIHKMTIGEVSHDNLVRITKRANFRSADAVIQTLNAVRPDLPQVPRKDADKGDVIAFHTNNWKGTRVGGPHTQNDLAADEVDRALAEAKVQLAERGWDLGDGGTRMLFLTHKAIADRLGYGGIQQAFEDNDEFVKLKDPILEFLVTRVEPAMRLLELDREGEAWVVLCSPRRLLQSTSDKREASQILSSLRDLCQSSSIGIVLDFVQSSQIPMPRKVLRLIEELRSETFNSQPRRQLAELIALLKVPFGEVSALEPFIAGSSGFATQHGVKGAEFENVIVILGGGWNWYNFPRFLAQWSDPDSVPDKQRATFLRTRNLFYVAASRPKRRLALLFTQPLEEGALKTLRSWTSAEPVSLKRPVAT